MTFTPFVLGTGLGGWAYLERTRDQQQELFEQSPVVDRSIQEFKEKITSITTSDQLMDDFNLLTVALGAFGLEEDIGNRAFIKKVLDSDLNDDESLANRLADERYKAMAETFGFNSPDGPQLPSSRGTQEFSDVESIDDLLSNRTLLRSVLSEHGLEGNDRNQFFLQRVLESDLDDPASFVNQLSDTRFVDFARKFNFNEPPEYDSKIDALLTEYNKYPDGLESVDDLLNDEYLLKATIEAFDIPKTNPLFFERVLKDVLLSDPADPDSYVNQLEDPRYLAVSKAFGFGVPDFPQHSDPDDLINDRETLDELLEMFDLKYPGADDLKLILGYDSSDLDAFEAAFEADFEDELGDTIFAEDVDAFRAFAEAYHNGWPRPENKLDKFSDEIADGLDSLTSGIDITLDNDLLEATLDLFGVLDRKLNRDGPEEGTAFLVRMQRLLDSDLSSDTSLANVHTDPRLRAMAHALNFNPGEATQVHPEGFAEEITELYTSRQFEVSVGQVDSNMRLALALERELTSIVESGGGEDAHWFNILGTPPMRTLFETALRLPPSFGQIDIDRQLVEIKERSQAVFGTDTPADFLEPDKLDEVRNRFLVLSDVGGSLGGGGFSDPLVSLFS